MNMQTIVESAFRDTFTVLANALPLMPLDRWNESVLRYFFGRCVAGEYGDVDQAVECSHIDLILRRQSEAAFIEFKLYARHRRVDPQSGNPTGFKGGPSKQNLREFRDSIAQLVRWPAPAGVSRYVVLVFADDEIRSSRRSQYSEHYHAYAHSDPNVFVQQVAKAGPVRTPDGSAHGRLLRVEDAGTRAAEQ